MRLLDSFLYQKRRNKEKPSLEYSIMHSYWVANTSTNIIHAETMQILPRCNKSKAQTGLSFLKPKAYSQTNFLSKYAVSDRIRLFMSYFDSTMSKMIKLVQFHSICCWKKIALRFRKLQSVQFPRV